MREFVVRWHSGGASVSKLFSVSTVSKPTLKASQESTVLLTGATGLVGRFLLAGLMRKRIPTVVFVRKSTQRSVHQRIDEALAPFENASLLPRPTVIEADLAKPDLGLDSNHRNWLRQQPLRVLHSAASIRFQADSPTSEPYLTNVQGTTSLLELLKTCQVQEFHHVSTAYVQCDRESYQTAREVPVTIANRGGNDYECSKIQSEQLVRNQFPNSTIYRPSIVVGDSRSGYSSTFHGFYAPLQIAAQLARIFGFDVRAGDVYREHLGLRHTDSKNFVSVDWVAAAVLELAAQPSAHGGIYHLTNPQPTSLDVMQSAILDALAEHFGDGTRRVELPDPLVFREQMSVYESYFLNDPLFDCSSTQRLLADKLPCPELNYETLHRLALWALRANFGWPKVVPPPKSTWQLATPSSAHLAAHLIDVNSSTQQLFPNVAFPNNSDVTQVDSSPESRLAISSQCLPNAPCGPVRSVLVELMLLGPSGLDSEYNKPQMLWTAASGWQAIAVHHDSAQLSECSKLQVMTTEHDFVACVIEKIDPSVLIASGRWTIQTDLSVNWLEIIRDWVQHLTVYTSEPSAMV